MAPEVPCQNHVYNNGLIFLISVFFLEYFIVTIICLGLYYFPLVRIYIYHVNVN